jgi:lysophospholipase L1-like esterase
MRHSNLARVFLLAASAILVGPFIHSSLFAQSPTSKTEEIDWTWEVRPTHADPKLPNVLLLGDSITRNYFPEVKRQLEGVANVYLMASSTSLGDPRLTHQIEEFSQAEGVPFSVVHFNNGMHGWIYTEQEYKAAFPSLLLELRAIAPKAAVIWASTTPVKKDKDPTDPKPGPTNARIDARNSMAQEALKSSGITTDDQHTLMAQHTDLYQDTVHFNEQGAAIQGQQVAQRIRALLTQSKP